MCYITGGYMLTTLNNINFQATIRASDTLQSGFDFARKRLNSGNSNYANYLANSINLMINDGTKDVYEVTKVANDYVLSKNNSTVYRRDVDNGKSVVFLLADYAQFNYSKGIVHPLPKGNTPKLILQNAKNENVCT